MVDAPENTKSEGDSFTDPESSSGDISVDSATPAQDSAVRIELDGPSRSDVLIEKARTAKGPSRFSLRWIFLWMVAASAGLAVLRASGMLRDWPDLLLLLLGISYFFAPLLCFFIAVYFNRRDLSHLAIVILAALGIAFVFQFALLSTGNATLRDLLGVSAVAAVLWALQFATLSLVNWGIFGKSRVARRLPDSVASKRAQRTSEEGREDRG